MRTMPLLGVVLFAVYIFRQCVHVMVQIAALGLGQMTVGFVRMFFVPDCAALLIKVLDFGARQFPGPDAVADAIILVMLAVVDAGIVMPRLRMCTMRGALGLHGQSGNGQSTGEGKADDNIFVHDGLH